MIFTSLMLTALAVLSGCNNDGLVSPDEGSGIFKWSVTDSVFYTTQIQIVDENTLLIAGDFSNCYKIQNGVKTRLELEETDFLSSTIKFLNADYFAFANTYSYSYPISTKIKYFKKGILNTISFSYGGYYDTRIFDFLLLDTNKLLINTSDSLFIFENSLGKKIKGSNFVLHTGRLAKSDGKIYVILFDTYQQSVSAAQIINDSLQAFSFLSDTKNIWIDNIKGKIVKEWQDIDRKTNLSYLSPQGWITFFSSNIKYFQSIAGESIDNFYFSARDSSNKIVRGYYNGRAILEDTNFPVKDSTGLSVSMLNGTIYASREIYSSGKSYIYKGVRR